MSGTVVGCPVELVERAVAGDAAARHRVVATVYPYIRNCARKVDRQRPDDTAQAAAEQVLRKLGDLREPTRLGTWIYTVVQNTARLAHRRESRLVATEGVAEREPDGAPGAEREFAAHEELAAVMERVERCRPGVQEVARRRLMGASFADAAAEAGVSVPAAKSIMHRLRLRLEADAEKRERVRRVEPATGPDRRGWWMESREGGGEEAMDAKMAAKRGPKGIDWSTQPLGKTSDTSLARKLGVTQSTVSAARRARGIPAFGEPAAAPRGAPNATSPAPKPSNVVPLTHAEMPAPQSEHPAVAALNDELRKAEAEAAAAADRVTRVRRAIAEVRSLLGLGAERRAS